MNIKKTENKQNDILENNDNEKKKLNRRKVFKDIVGKALASESFVFGYDGNGWTLTKAFATDEGEKAEYIYRLRISHWSVYPRYPCYSLSSEIGLYGYRAFAIPNAGCEYSISPTDESTYEIHNDDEFVILCHHLVSVIKASLLDLYKYDRPVIPLKERTKTEDYSNTYVMREIYMEELLADHDEIKSISNDDEYAAFMYTLLMPTIGKSYQEAKDDLTRMAVFLGYWISSGTIRWWWHPDGTIRGKSLFRPLGRVHLYWERAKYGFRGSGGFTKEKIIDIIKLDVNGMRTYK